MAYPTIDSYLFTDTDKRKLPNPPAGGSLTCLKSELTIPTASLALNYVTRVLWVPEGFQLWGMAIKMADLDGGTALVWDLGWRAAVTTDDDQNGIVAGSTIGQSAGQLNTDDMAVAGFGYTFQRDSDIVLTVTTAAGTAAAGACKFALFGTMP